jgi:CRP-like cAMP-binding protein
MANPLLTILELRDRLAPEEAAVVEGLVEKPVRVDAGEDLVRHGESPKHSTVMLSGLSARYNLLRDGKRQISAVHIAGDFIDLHSFLLDPMDHSVTALTDCDVVEVPHTVLREISETLPHLTRMFWLLTVIDAAIFRQWLVASGHLPAAGQIAHFFCEIYVRMTVVGLADGHAFDLPISQSDLGDAMGLSNVHVSRCLKALREDGVLQWDGKLAVIQDWQALKALAEFDPSYLNLARRRR